VALEAADGFFGAIAFGSLAGDVVLGLGVTRSRDGDAVDRRVDLTVAAAIESVTVGVAGAGWDRGDAGGAGELGVGGESGGAGDLAD
jgi:hypothetical protein